MRTVTLEERISTPPFWQAADGLNQEQLQKISPASA